MPMRLHHLLIVAPLALAGCHDRAKAVGADRAWIRLAAVPGRPAAAYFTLHGGAEPVRLVAVDVDQAGSSELHESMAGANMASMRRIDGVDLPAGGEIAFQPGGRHVMLFGMSPQARPSGRATLTLRFAKGPAVAVPAKLVGAGEAAPY
jgi:periplasmic copper chaperone A